MELDSALRSKTGTSVNINKDLAASAFHHVINGVGIPENLCIKHRLEMAKFLSENTFQEYLAENVPSRTFEYLADEAFQFVLNDEGFSRFGPTQNFSALPELLTVRPDTVAMRRAAVDALAQIAGKGNAISIEAVMQRLAHANAGVRRAAVDALGKITEKGNVAVIYVLAERLQDDVTAVWRAAVEALSNISGRGDSITIRAVGMAVF